MRKYGIGYETVQRAPVSALPEPRKKMRPRATRLDPYKPAIDAILKAERRIKAAGFPRDKSLRKFDFDTNPNIDPVMIHTLAKRECARSPPETRRDGPTGRQVAGRSAPLPGLRP